MLGTTGAAGVGSDLGALLVLIGEDVDADTAEDAGSDLVALLVLIGEDMAQTSSGWRDGAPVYTSGG